MSNEMTVADITKTTSLNEIVTFIDGSIKRTTQQVLETGYGFFMLKEVCERDKEDFTTIIEERYNLNKTNASRWVKIGSQYNRLMEHRDILPSSYSTIYSLITLPNKAFKELVKSGQINPSITFEMAEHYKAIHKANNKVTKEVKKEAKENPDINPFEIAEEPVEVIEKEKEKPIKKKESEIVEGEFEEVKPQKKKEKLTITKALEMLEINLDDQFLLAKQSGIYSDEELIKAISILTEA